MHTNEALEAKWSPLIEKDRLEAAASILLLEAIGSEQFVAAVLRALTGLGSADAQCAIKAARCELDDSTREQARRELRYRESRDVWDLLA